MDTAWLEQREAIDFEQAELEAMILAADDYRTRLRHCGMLMQLGTIEAALTKLKAALDHDPDATDIM